MHYFYLARGSTRIVDLGPSFRMRRLWILWRHDYDIVQSRDVIDDINVIDDVTNRRAMGIFL